MSQTATVKDAENRMKKTLESFKEHLTKVRTGRASTGVLDNVTILYYDNPTPLSQIGSVNVSDSHTLSVTPWEKNLIPEIEKAIRDSGLGFSVRTQGASIFVSMPPLTEERRKEFVKMVKAEAENARVSVRNVRRDANDASKAAVKKKEISEDDERRLHDTIQKLTDQYITFIDKALEEKEKELMAV